MNLEKAVKSTANAYCTELTAFLGLTEIMNPAPEFVLLA
jgi:hypothetical protein